MSLITEENPVSERSQVDQRLGNLRFHAEEPEGLGGVVMVAHESERCGLEITCSSLYSIPTMFFNDHFEDALMWGKM